MQLSDAKVTFIKETEHRRGVQWTMEICIGKKVICVAENSGLGGPNHYTVFDDKAWPYLIDLAEAALSVTEAMELILCCCEIGDTLQDGVAPAREEYAKWFGGDR
tara:strand:+ start:344 stop:658 length:315 start_codon:yes stop_codon:yes gene_type:complete